MGGSRRSARIELRDGEDWLLVVDPTGTATALPGPGLGGVVEVSLLAADGARPTSTSMLTAQGHPLMTLPASWWPSDDDASRAVALLRNAGLRITTLRVPRAAVQPPPPRRRLEPSFALDQVVFMTVCFGGLLCLTSVLARAPVATGISAVTIALALGVGLFERRQRR